MDGRLRGRKGCGRGAGPHGVGTPDTSVGNTDVPDEGGDEGALLPLPAEATAATRSGPNDPGLVAALFVYWGFRARRQRRSFCAHNVILVKLEC